MSTRTAAPEQVVFGDALIEPEIYRKGSPIAAPPTHHRRFQGRRRCNQRGRQADLRSKLRQADQSVGLQYIEDFAIDHIQCFWQILLIWHCLQLKYHASPMADVAEINEISRAR